jgi:HAD superfamily phosphoserine phosphatase-like hydrolase
MNRSSSLSSPTAPRLAAFDMDGTLLKGRVIYEAAREFRIMTGLQVILRSRTAPYLRSKRVASLLRGRSVGELAEVVRGMPLNEGAESAVQQLKQSGYKVGIISDSYTLATGIIARRLELDFDVANVLAIRGDRVTGRLEMPTGWEKIGCRCRQSVCKQYALRRMAEKLGAQMSETIAVGDSTSDLCMITNAGTGIWFSPTGTAPPPTARNVISTGDLLTIPGYAKK